MRRVPDLPLGPACAGHAPRACATRAAAANGFSEHNAHDALGDVQATIYLCKLMCERALRIWTTFIRFNKKLPVQNLLRYEPIVCLTEFYGAAYSWLVTAIGRNADNDNEICVIDLNENPEELSRLNDQELTARLGKSPKPLRWVRANSCPILMPSEGHDGQPSAAPMIACMDTANSLRGSLGGLVD